ncbi:O-methyltransferase [Gorillibacterium timonense]|uniref:O-methyltransferase n=1 Tax=Gorillibacterium timonense TaxID=1689269 RepID=UPI001F1E11BA|nr:O-methyltransferase [Gorillibacterium timonense]
MIDELSLSRQIDYVFREIRDELMRLSSGTVFVQIRNNVVGKFGIKHNPLESRDGCMQLDDGGLSESQVSMLHRMAVDSLRYKVNWTHGEIFYEFAVQKTRLCASVQFESNYNYMSRKTR